MCGIQYTIYTLVDDSGIFYVGCTCSALDYRLGGHISDARSFFRRGRTFCNREKCERIVSSDFKVKIVPIDATIIEDTYGSRRQASSLEKHWIYKLSSDGHQLTNREIKVLRRRLAA